MSTGFITEKEVNDIKNKRQEEWEKVRKPDDPTERPEEPYDNRSLYDKLMEQKEKKELEIAESKKHKSLIRGLDDDEAQFLDFVDQTRLETEKNQREEENNELKDYRARVNDLKNCTLEKGTKNVEALKMKNVSTRVSQKSLLEMGVKRKFTTEKCEKKIKPDAVLHCIGILPGIGKYGSDSENSENSSDEDLEKHSYGIADIVKKKICLKEKD